MTATNSTGANGRVRGGLGFHDLRKGDRLIWTQVDGARVFIIVTRLSDPFAYLRCHYGDRTWTRRHELPLFSSMKPGYWTPADVKQEADRGK